MGLAGKAGQMARRFRNISRLVEPVLTADQQLVGADDQSGREFGGNALGFQLGQRQRQLGGFPAIRFCSLLDGGFVDMRGYGLDFESGLAEQALPGR